MAAMALPLKIDNFQQKLKTTTFVSILDLNNYSLSSLGSIMKKSKEKTFLATYLSI